MNQMDMVWDIERTSKKIKSDLFEGNVQGVQESAQLYRAANPQDGNLAELFDHLMRDHFGLFSFQSFSTNITQINQERLRRECALLSLFDVQKQLFLLGWVVDDIQMEHLDIMSFQSNLSGKSQQYLEAVLNKLLFEERFDLLDQLAQKTTIPMEGALDEIYMRYKTPGVRGSTLIHLDAPYPWYASFHFSPTSAKRDQLLSMGIGAHQLQHTFEILNALESNKPTYFPAEVSISDMRLQSQSLLDELALTQSLEGASSLASKKKVM